MSNIRILLSALNQILQTTFYIDGYEFTFEGIIIFLCVIAVICFLIGGLLK